MTNIDGSISSSFIINIDYEYSISFHVFDPLFPLFFSLFFFDLSIGLSLLGFLRHHGLPPRAAEALDQSSDLVDGVDWNYPEN